MIPFWQHPVAMVGTRRGDDRGQAGTADVRHLPAHPRRVRARGPTDQPGGGRAQDDLGTGGAPGSSPTAASCATASRPTSSSSTRRPFDRWRPTTTRVASPLASRRWSSTASSWSTMASTPARCRVARSGAVDRPTDRPRRRRASDRVIGASRTTDGADGRPTEADQFPGMVASRAGVVLPSKIGRSPTGSSSSKTTPNGVLPWQSWPPGRGAIEKVMVSGFGPVVDVRRQDPALGRLAAGALASRGRSPSAGSPGDRSAGWPDRATRSATVITPGSGAAGVSVPAGPAVGPELGEATAALGSVVDARLGGASVVDGDEGAGDVAHVQAAKTRTMSARATVVIGTGYGHACRSAARPQAGATADR